MLLRCDATDENGVRKLRIVPFGLFNLAVSAERPNNVLMRRDSNSFF